MALRGSKRFVRRLARAVLPPATATGARAPCPPRRPSARRSTAPGALETLVLREVDREPPGPGQVEIRVEAVGPQLPRRDARDGDDSSARARGDDVRRARLRRRRHGLAVGPGVDGLSPGDEVVGLAPAALGRYAVTDAALVVPQASGARLRRGLDDPVRVRDGDLRARAPRAARARRARARPRRLGRRRPRRHPGRARASAPRCSRRRAAPRSATTCARSASSTSSTRARSTSPTRCGATGGRGVDVVLNSLAGEAIAKGIDVLAPYGRFVEIGKRDIYEDARIGLRAFRKNLSYFAVDLDRLCLERPEVAGEFVRQAVEQGRRRHLRGAAAARSSRSSRPRTQCASWRRRATSARSSSRSPDEEVSVHPPAGDRSPIRARRHLPGHRRARRLRAAHRRVARARGRAEHRAHGPSDRASATRRRGSRPARASRSCRRREQAGGRAPRARDDSREAAAAARRLPRGDGARRRAARRARPPSGCEQSSPEGLGRLEPPRGDARRRARLLRPLLVDRLPVRQHGAGELRRPANTFLDALAHHRRALGLPALAINWGSLGEVGYVSSHEEIASYLERMGFLRLSPAQAIDALSTSCCGAMSPR